jgi:uncharacterized protein
MNRVAIACAVALLTLSLVAEQSGFSARLVAAADDRPNHPARYDPGYVKIPYPNGDVPSDSGVCTDEIIRIYRAVGIDLQKQVHEDMLANRSAYPTRLKWMQVGTDTNIDHRRVPNLQVFFQRKAQSLPITKAASDYQPGDIVIWMLPNGRDHIGMVVDRKSLLGTPMVEHNIGEGPKIENVLFDWKITGHYRYQPAE